MAKKLGVVMDPIATIHRYKDSTFAMLLEAKARGYEIYYFEQENLKLIDGVPYGDARLLTVKDDEHQYFQFIGQNRIPLAECDIILMRKDPPFNEEYIYTTYILEHAERLGSLVVNRPQSLRDANEKMFATYFPQCMPKTLVTRTRLDLDLFLHEQKDIVCKPLNGMGGASVFRLRANDVNAHAVFSALTDDGKRFIMVQSYIPDITLGDKRILMINGEPVPHVLARIPSEDDWRGNLALGAKGIVQPISPQDLKICEIVGPVLRQLGLYFVGLDVIGNYLTEINVTSPTCIREIDAATNLNIAAQLFDVLESL